MLDDNVNLNEDVETRFRGWWSNGLGGSFISQDPQVAARFAGPFLFARRGAR